MNLKLYKKKRDFSKTLEPEGSNQLSAIRPQLPAKDKEMIFVIHDHYATQHHHDLRLESKGVLRSWALPKLTPQKGEKHLAVQVEDHPIEYASFTGTIPEGEYGAGKVKIYDKGTYKIIHETKNTVEILFMGKKVKGIYALVKFTDNPKNWLFFKTTKKEHEQKHIS